MAETTLEYHGAQSTPCPSTKDLLDRVTRELNHFEAKKLPELKAELEAFEKKKDDVVADYEKKYPGLRDKWCVQQQQIEKLYAALKCSFPDWKKSSPIASASCATMCIVSSSRSGRGNGAVRALASAPGRTQAVISTGRSSVSTVSLPTPRRSRSDRG